MQQSRSSRYSKQFRLVIGVVLFALSLFLEISSSKVRASSANIPESGDAQQQTSALERGYRAGYSDGYEAGYSDNVANTPKNYSNKEDYRRADRAYNSGYGPVEEYRDGYQQGFESGYAAGYDHHGFDSTIPAGLSRRGGPYGNTAPPGPGPSGGPPVAPADAGASVGGQGQAGTGAVFAIPGDTVMRVELLTNLSTDASQMGDLFQARVAEPREYENATVYGRVTRVKRAGRTSSAELQLAFDQVRFADGRSAAISAQVIEVVRGGGNAAKVDPEGGIKGPSAKKDDVAKVGAGAGVGAIIGAIAGGGTGAAIGAVIGGGVGTGGVLASHGKDIRLPRGQQLRIRTARAAQIQGGPQ